MNRSGLIFVTYFCTIFFKLLNIFRKILFYLALFCGVIFLSLTISVFLFKDRIINQFIREANKQLNTPVKVGKMDVSMWTSFPKLSIVLKDVYVEDSHPGQYPLLTAAEISFQLNMFDTWAGNYVVQGLKVYDSETNLKVNTNGENNYTIAKPSEGTGGRSVSFALHDVLLKNTRVSYSDLYNRQSHIYVSKDLTASIETAEDIYTIQSSGELTTEKIEIERQSYLRGKSFNIETKLVYDDIQKILTINPSLMALKGSEFKVSGSYKWKSKNLIDLQVDGKDTDIQTILSLLPESTAGSFEKYRSKGNVYFNGKLKGEISANKSPGISIDFGCTNTTLYHPDYKSKIEDASVKGSFASREMLNSTGAVLILKNVSGRLNDEPFTGNLIIQNFENPDVICDFKGKVDAGALLGFYPIEGVDNASGTLLADVAFKGRIELLKRKATAQKVSTQGTIDLQNIAFTFGKDHVGLKGLNGNLQFSNNDLALSNVTGKIGNSDFALNGFFKNIITFLLFENQPIGIETDLKSNYLDVDELFAIGFGSESTGKSEEYQFSISRNINLNFNCDVKQLRYKRFHATNLKGDMLVKNEMAVCRNINFHAMGGDMILSGIVDSHNKKAIEVVSNFKLNGIYIDSIFYVFENFNQDFIQDKHLKGQTSADVNLEMVLDQNLRLFSETLVGDISASIKNGELNNFEPMRKLKRYLNDEGLSKMRFSDIKNDIHIEKKTIYIPQMEVRTNVTTIKVSGTHTFGQLIDYHIIAPIRNNKNINYQEAKGALEEDGSQTKLLLRIKGTTDDYRISYDTEAVKKKIANDFKNEVKELKEAFKNKGTKEKKEVELQKDEYFEWDEEPAPPH
ncbi:MAG: AsmA-like C-terminal region-containing protein [Chryseolinea sp.]